MEQEKARHIWHWTLREWLAAILILIVGAAVAFFAGNNHEDQASSKAAPVKKRQVTRALGKSKAHIASNAYMSYAIKSVEDSSPVYYCYSDDYFPLEKGDDGKWHYKIDITWCQDGGTLVNLDSHCWSDIRITGNNRKVRIRQLGKEGRCSNMLPKATYLTREKKLVEGWTP